MTIHTREIPVITNVSRRRVLQGLGGGLVLAAQFPAVQALAYPTGADKMPNGVVSDPKIFVSIAPDGIVTIVAARAEMGTGAARTTLPMIVADELDADWAKVRIAQSPGRREEIRQPGHRRLAQRAPLPAADAAVRRLRAHHAGAGGGEALGRQRGRVRRAEPRDHAQADRAQARLWRGRRRCGRAAGPGGRPGAAEGPGRVPLHRQGQRPAGRPVRHHGRDCHLRAGRAASRHEIRRGGAPAGGRRQGRVVRRDRDHEGAGRREGRAARRHAGAGEVQSARRRRGDREEYLGGDQGPRGAEDRLG